MTDKVVRTMLRQCLAVMRREVYYLWRDKGLRNILLAGSVLGLLVFYAIYSAQVLIDIPTAVADLDCSRESRQLTEDFSGAENLKVVAHPGSFAEVEELIRQGQILVGIVIPEHYARDVSLRRQGNLSIIIDGSNMIYATNAANTVLAITGRINARAGIKTLMAGGMHPDQAREAYSSVTFREEPWFNPALNYAYFLVLALALNLWQQCCMLAACQNIIGETGRKSWLQLKAAGVSKLMFFFSKSVVQITVFTLTVLPVYYLSFIVFKLPLACGFWMLFLFTLVFAVALQATGTLVSSFARTAVNSTRFGMIIAVPSFILCGYTWPLEAMPRIVQQVVKVLPQTWFFQGINYLTFKDPGWTFMSPFFSALLVIAAVSYAAAAVIASRS